MSWIHGEGWSNASPYIRPYIRRRRAERLTGIVLAITLFGGWLLSVFTAGF